MRRIMIIRHAEKPGDADPDHGVTCDGVHDAHDLTVRGWQRAGALVRFFAPHGQVGFAHDAVSTPVTIIASAATHDSPSRRALHTVTPLADALGIGIDHDDPAGEEARVAALALEAPSPVLIAWHHSHIARLAHAIAGPALAIPARWPDDRFDVVWVLDRAEDAGGWTLTQVPQRVLAHDRATPIAG